MAGIFLPRRTIRQKPPLGTQINAGHQLAQGIVGLWVFNEEGGSSVTDAALGRSGRLVSANNIPSWSFGVKGDCLYFPGGTNGGYVYACNGPILSGLSSFSISTLITSGVSPSGPIYCERAQSGSDILKLEISANIYQLTYRNDAGSLAATGTFGGSIAPSTTYHLAVTKAGTSIAYYINGVQVSVTTYNVTDILTNTGIESRIGADTQSLGDRFPGNIYSVALHNRALSAAEVQQLYLDPYCMLQAARQVWGLPAATGMADPFPLVYPRASQLVAQPIYSM